MNEADTRRELIDPKIKEAGWGEIVGSYIRAEFQITNGEIKTIVMGTYSWRGLFKNNSYAYIFLDTLVEKQ